MPDSPDWSAAYGAKTLIATCPTFQAGFTPATYAEALNHVDILESEPTDECNLYPRPFGLVLFPRLEYNIRYPHYPTGIIQVMLEMDIPASLAPVDELRLGANFFGGIKADMSLLCATWRQPVDTATLRVAQIVQPTDYRRGRDTEGSGKPDTNGFWQAILHLVLGD